MIGAHLQRVAKATIKRLGQQVTIKSALTGASRTAWCIPMDVDPGVSDVRPEGSANMVSEDLTDFKFAGDEDLKEDDLIQYGTATSGGAFWYRITAVHGSPIGGVFPSFVAHTVREKRV